MTDAALELIDASKSFNHRKAVDSLSFQAAPGDILGFLGPLGRIIPTAAKGELALNPAFASQLVFMGLTGILAVVLILAIRRPTQPA